MLQASRVALGAILVATPVFAQSLVKDINPLTVNGNGAAATTTQAVVVGTAAYFPGTDGVNGIELWRTDGTAAGTVMLKDINTTALGASSSPTVITPFAGGILFAANDGTTGIELWKSDGTAAGTVQVKDIYPGASTSSSPTALTVIGSACYFFATDATATTGTGRELWVTDGTAAGTTLVKDIQVGTPNGISTTATTPMVAIGTTLYFPAVDVATTGTELWKSDGTTVGTVMVKDINAAASGSSSPLNFAVFGTKLLFNATDGVAGVEPWVSDGTAAGTVMLLDAYPGASSSTPATPYTVAATVAYFSAIDSTAGTGTGREMYVTDGTPANTKLIVDLMPGIDNGATTIGYLAIGNRCTFQGRTSTYGVEGYITDGTAAGTVLFADCWPGPNSGFPSPIFPWNGKYYMNAGNGSFAANNFELMVTDGTPAGTQYLKEIAPGGFAGDPNGFFVLNGKLFFMANDGTTGIELWTTDGTTAGTVLVKEINAVGLTTSSSSPGPMVKLGNRVYFAANDGSIGVELWSSDGTAAGTTLVKDICVNAPTSSSSSSSPANLTVFNGKLYFAANDGATGVELWTSDGSAAGTTLVKDINTTGINVSSSPASFVASGNKLYFTANDGLNGIELWVTDGTTAGTSLVKDLSAGTASSSPAVMTAFNGKLFFRATEPTGLVEPYLTDGTAAGTVMLMDVNPGAASSTPSNPTVNGGKLFFTALAAATGTELYVTDGTPAGTSLVIDLFPTASSGATTTAGTIVPFGNGVLFQGSNGSSVNGFELWASDGTAAGTTMVKDINAGTAASSPNNMTVFGSLVLMFATTAAAGAEPWVSDGTNAGTVQLIDAYPGTSTSTAGPFVVAGSGAFFLATNSTATTGTGRELYVTDGTPAGTSLVKDVFPGTSSGCSATPVALGVGKKVVFAGTDGVAGIELWVSDGTTAGTTMISDYFPGATTSSPTNFAVVGDSLLLSATNGTDKVANPAAVGIELCRVALNALGVSEAEGFGTSCQGTGTPTIGYAGGAPFVGNASFAVTLANAKASTPAALVIAPSRFDVVLGACTIYPSLVAPAVVNSSTGATGAGSVNLPIPNTPALIGGPVYGQWAIADVGGPLFGAISLSNGLRIRIGGS